MKKNIILSLSMMIGVIVNGQVAIGKEADHASALLDFKEDTTSGIILPQLSLTNSERSSIMFGGGKYEKGTIFYDCINRKVVYLELKGITGTLIDLSDGSSSTTVCKNYVSLNEKGGGIIIGAETSTAKGVLVLESNNKALLLPRVANAYDKIKSPEPGTLVYDPTNKVLSIYNGETWAFWSN